MDENKTLTPDDPEYYSVENMTPEEFAEYLAELEADEEEETEEAEETSAASEDEAEAAEDTEEVTAGRDEETVPPSEAKAADEAARTEPMPQHTPNAEHSAPAVSDTPPSEAKVAPPPPDDTPARFAKIEAAARGRYGEAWEEKLINQLDEAAAEEKGISVEEYRKTRRDSEDLQRYRDNDSKREEQEKRAQEIIEAWNADEAAIKESDPSFDLKKAMQEDADFRDRVLSGASVAAAYIATGKGKPKPEEPKAEESKGEKKTDESKPEPKKKRKEITQNAQSAAQRGTGDAEDNPAQYSERDFKEYINRIKNQS